MPICWGVIGAEVTGEVTGTAPHCILLICVPIIHAAPSRILPGNDPPNLPNCTPPDGTAAGRIKPASVAPHYGAAIRNPIPKLPGRNPPIHNPPDRHDQQRAAPTGRTKDCLRGHAQDRTQP